MRTIVLVSFVFFGFLSFAQQHSTTYTECQMSVDEILRQQSFDIDEPVSETARNIFFEIYEDLNLIYKSNSNSAQRDEYIEEFEQTIQQAEDLNLNLEMFKDDIDNVSEMTK